MINTQAVQIETLTGQVEALSAQLAAQVARIEELERRLGSDSSNSSKPPSSDPPYRKPEWSSSCTASDRRPGKGIETAGLPIYPEPTAAWWAQRPLWLLVPGVLLAALIAVFARAETHHQ